MRFSGSSASSLARAKAKFVLATDGDTFEAGDLNSGEKVACAYADFPDHFGFFPPLVGISAIRRQDAWCKRHAAP